MGRPKGGYKVDGEKVRGVTTITSRFKDSGGLIHWAWQQGMDGQDYRESRDKAADAGTCCHDMIEADWNGVPFDRSKFEPDTLKKADHSFLAYLEWKDQVNLKIIHSELSLTSEIYRFGGTLDAMMVSNRLRLGDWKTSNGIYADMLVQVAGGYSLLWEENYPDEPLDGIEIIRFSKPESIDDPISFHHHSYSAEIIPICQKQFLHFLAAYNLDRRIKKFI